MPVSLDWLAVILALLVVSLIKLGIVSGVRW